jgi:hypothetical protein
MLVKKSIILIFLLSSLVLTATAYSQSESDSALHRRPIFTSPLTYKLSKSYTKTYWGTQLFINSRSSILQYVTHNPYEELISNATFHIDHAWNRMVYEEYGKPWIRAYGNQGSGTEEFLWPRSFDVQSFCDPWLRGRYYRIFVADTDNKRIACIEYDYTDESIVWDRTITHNDLGLPTDLNINNSGTFVFCFDDYLWVLDGYQIKCFDMFNNLRISYGTYGCSGYAGQFCSPTAVVCGRSYIPESPEVDPNADNRYIYVADPGNDRIVWLEKEPQSYNINWMGTVSTAGSHIVDLEVDNFGQVWAVDRDNGFLIKYTYDLFPLCTYGTTPPAGECQFYWPLGISCAGGYWGCGNIMITESWSDTSGIQYFDIGTDVVDFSVRPSNNGRWHYIRYVLIDQSKVSVKVIDNMSQVVKTIREGVEISGQSFYVWDGSNDANQTVPTGQYNIIVYDTSSYWALETGQPSSMVTRSSGFFTHVRNPYTDYIPGDVNDDGNVNLADAVHLTNFVFKGGPEPQPYMCVGDVNADTRVNVGDAVCIINYVFKAGAAPRDGCWDWP